MKYRKYLLLLLALFVGMVAKGQSTFNPTDPAEPNPTYKVTVKAMPAEGGTVTGGGRYVVNKNITLKATAASEEWTFVNWTLGEGGDVLSTNSSYSYKVTNQDVIIVANFVQNATSMLTTQSNPTGLFSARTTKYKVGQSVSVSCSTYSYYTFQNWTNSHGEVVSENRSFNYTVTEEDETLTANYKFTPGSPTEPSETKAKHKVYFSSTPCSASFNRSSGFQVEEGSTYSITAYTVSNYEFEGWYKNDQLAGTDRTYTEVMGQQDVTLVAKYSFSPGSPNEPGTSGKSKFTLYGLTADAYKGETTILPIYLENTAYVKALTFSINLPEGINVNPAKVQTTSRTTAYTPTASLEGQTLTVTLEGGTQIADYNGPIVQVPIVSTSTIEDGSYSYTFSNITATLMDDSEATVTSRRGTLNITTLEEGDLQAQFSVDRYMNRAQFTNLTSGEARSYLWEFGDGTTSTEANPMHIYATPGTYTVRLTAKAIVKTSEAEQSIVINPTNTWVASGDYTLNANGTGVRNFTSLEETINLLNQCTPDGNIIIEVAPDKVYSMVALDEASLTMIQSLANKLGKAGKSILWKADEKAPATISFQTNIVAEDMQKVLSLLALCQTENVNVMLDGMAINTTALVAETEQTVCSGDPSELVRFNAITDSPMLSTSWFATVAEGNHLTGYETKGEGNLPSMIIDNQGTAIEEVSYHVMVSIQGIAVLQEYIYKVRVRPTLAGKTLSLTSPANNATVLYGNQTLQWTNLNSIATKYEVTVKHQVDGEEVSQVLTSTTNSVTLSCKEGTTYTWQVKAIGVCDEIVSEEGTFSVRQKSDLIVTEVTAPADAQGLSTISIKAVIKNQGPETTYSSHWYDVLYWSTQNDGTGLTQLTEKYHSQKLQSGESYEVTFDVTAPDASQYQQVYYYVKTDSYGNEAETSESNNMTVSEAMEVVARYMAKADYEALKTLYNATNGEAWTTPWKINTAAITTNAWKGVTFSEDGHVLTINLQSNNLQGSVPTEGFALESLTSLNLSHNVLKGDLAAFVSNLPALTTLDMSYNQFSKLDGVLPATITNLSLGYQQNKRSYLYFTAQNWDISAHIDNVNLGSLISYNHAAQDFSAHPRLVVKNSTQTVGYLNWNKTEEAYAFETYGTYRLESGADLQVQATEGTAAYCKLRAILSWKQGDANADGETDVLDAQQELNYILSRHSGNFNYNAANTYADETINVQDIVATINLFLDEDQVAEVRQQRLVASRLSNNENLSSNHLFTEEGALVLSSVDPVAALDIDLKGVRADQVSLALSKSRFQMIVRNTAQGVRVVIISTNGSEISTGETKILHLSADADILAVKAADIDAHEMSIQYAGEATGIEGIGDSDAAGVYNIAGQRITSKASANALKKGVYIINGRKVLK